jgi:anti-anti-sigma regulatory factor
MSSHLRLSTMSQHAHQGDAAAVAQRSGAGVLGNGGGADEIGLSEVTADRPRLTLASPPAWRHKLILMGRLDQRTAPDLEEEIECLCQEGVTTLTLDLRQLVAIDPAGVKAIAFRGASYRRHGRDFAVIAGSHPIGRALCEVGATDLLAPDPGDDTVVPLVPVDSLDGPLPSRSTAMIKSL